MSVAAAVDEALIGRLQGDATLAALVTAVHANYAPEGSVPPYAVVALQTELSTPEQGGPAFREPRFQVGIFDLNPKSTRAKTAFDRVDALLDGQTFTAVGHTVMLCERVERFLTVTRDGNEVWWHAGGDYHLMVDPS